MGKSVQSTARPLGRTQTSFANLACAAATLILALIACLSLADRADAADFCVGPAQMTGCPAGGIAYAETELPDAIADSISNGQFITDHIYLYSGTYDSLNGFNLGASWLQIHGVGPTKPILTIAGVDVHNNKTVLSSTSNTSLFENIAIELPSAVGNTGLSATGGGATIRDVEISGPGSFNGTGIVVGGSSPEILRTKIDLPYAGSASTGIAAESANSLTIRDLEISRARGGISLNQSQNASIQRAEIVAPFGIIVTNSPGANISSSLMRPALTDDGVTGGYSVRTTASAGTDTLPTLIYNSTLIGRSGSGSSGALVRGTTPGSQAHTEIDSTVIFGHDAPVTTEETGGTADATADYSRLGGTIPGGTNLTQGTGTQSISSDPGFVDPANGNYMLKLTSSLVDVGNPGALAGSSASDLAGAPRITSRGAGLIRDIGAYEAQSVAPVARISVLTPSPSSTNPVNFSAADSTDADGDTMSYSWRFDSKTFATGVTTSKLFPEIGLHTVELTVTDSTGQSATTLTQVNVERGFLAMKIRSQNVRASAKGRFAITVTCPEQATTNCTGRLIFQTVKKIEARNYQDKPKSRSAKPKILRAANYVFTIEPGTTRKLSIQTYGTFQNVLKKHKKFKLSASLVSGSTSNAILTANRPTFTLSAPKPKRR